MKYIKTYEINWKEKLFGFKYGNDDYIIYNDKILKLKSTTTIEKKLMDKPYVQYIGIDSEDNKFLLGKNDIIRFATPEEIEQYNTEVEAKKYNL